MEKSTVLEQREDELRKSLQKNAPWGSYIDFLDTINTVEELNQLAPILIADEKLDLVEYYRDNLIRWSDPQLPDDFDFLCPRLTARLDTPQKIRILLRGAYFRDVDPLLMGEVFEEIIRRHEVDGEQKVVYKNYRGSDDEYDGDRYKALRIVYHTQMQARTLTKLALPGSIICGHGTDGLYVDWRSEAERKAAGES